MIRSLKLEEWPEDQRSLWHAAEQPGGRLSKGGSASHMKPVTRADLARRYGLFLEHVQRIQGAIPDMVADSVTPILVNAYVLELQGRVGTVTVHGCVAKLARVTKLLEADTDWQWLRDIAAELGFAMRPRNKNHRIVESHVIVGAGLKQMAEAAQSTTLNPIRRAELYRNGLMIALLATCPIRLRNFAGLALGRNVLRLGDSWLLKLTADETKEGRPDERPIPQFLADHLDIYLRTYRPLFGHEDNALWVGRTRTALQPHAVARNITATTQQLLGKPISPHLFRSCAASTAVLHLGSQPHLASGLLNHRSPKVTEEHYIRVRSYTYSKKFGALVDGLARK